MIGFVRDAVRKEPPHKMEREKTWGKSECQIDAPPILGSALGNSIIMMLLEPPDLPLASRRLIKRMRDLPHVGLTAAFWSGIRDLSVFPGGTQSCFQVSVVIFSTCAWFPLEVHILCTRRTKVACSQDPKLF
jgi:hypothetical protein